LKGKIFRIVSGKKNVCACGQEIYCLQMIESRTDLRTSCAYLFVGQSMWGNAKMLEKCEKMINILTKVVSKDIP